MTYQKLYCTLKKFIFEKDLALKKRADYFYGNTVGVELSQQEREGFKDILTGYPPQVLYCVDYIHDTSLEYVMRNSHEIVEKFSKKVTEVLSSSFHDDLADDAMGFLSFLSHFGVVPTILVFELFDINKKYRKLQLQVEQLGNRVAGDQAA